jgi:hypothetical protein
MQFHHAPFVTAAWGRQSPDMDEAEGIQTHSSVGVLASAHIVPVDGLWVNFI